MATDHIRYDILVQEALRGVARRVLEDAAKNGLPGDHHFFITFDTGAEGVRLSQRMQAQYPKEMTIVLQHQFWDLTVSQQGFEVGLSFGGVPERLVVPFAAIKGFADPTGGFEVKFEEVGEEAAAPAAPEVAAAPPRPEVAAAPPRPAEPQPPQLPAEPKPARTTPAVAAVPKPTSPPAPTAASDDGPDKPSGGGEVVRLDRFRKK
jgi:uncharacterized protein